jgi:flagellar M-ring protein FliF
MDQIKKLLASFSKQQIIGFALVVLLVGGGITSFVKWNHNRSFKALFTGMSPEDAAAIVQKLKESGVEHRISENGTSVLVPETMVDELRLEMAGAGLPKTGRIGFELFDRNNLGITDFTEHVNYRRALEGELERSIRALNVVEQARVHLTFPKDSVFLDYREPAKASVLVHTRVGTRLSPQNVTAIANLVASAVEELTPELVSVLDMQGNLLSRPHRKSGEEGEPSEAALDYKHQIEKDLVAKVESTLEPLLGEGRFRVGVTADCDFTTSEQSEEVFDPTKSVMATSQKSEDVVGGSSQSAGVPGTSSNLPRAVPRSVTPSTGSSRRTENTSFETSKTVRHLKVPQGAIKRISASLLLDQEARWEGQGKNRKRVIVPPTPEQIKKINDIVAGVLGLDTQRGDRLVVESLPFEQTLLAEDAPDPAAKMAENPKKGGTGDLLHDKRIWIGAGAGLAVLLAGTFFLLKRKRKTVEVKRSAALPQASDTAAEVRDSVQLSEAAEESKQPLELGTEPLLQLPPMSKRIEALRDHIKESVKKEPEMAAEILRGWLAETKK